VLFYVDEFGDGGLGPKSVAAHPWFILGAAGIRDINRKSIANTIREIKGTVFGPKWTSKPWKDTEIKGRYVAHALDEITKGRTPKKPKGYIGLTKGAIDELIDSLWKVYNTFHPTLYAIGVDKQKELSVPRTVYYNPIAIAYAYLQQRLSALSQHSTNGEEPMLILADEQKEHEKLFRSGQVNIVRRTLQRGMPNIPDIHNIIAKPVWIDSDEMEIDREITQLVDLMLYSVSRGMLHGDWAHSWLENLGSHFARHWGKAKGLGAIWNAGITIYPRSYYRRGTWADK